MGGSGRPVKWDGIGGLSLEGGEPYHPDRSFDTIACADEDPLSVLAALERGVKVTGATVHFVDSGMDTGPIILQKAVEVQDGDTPEVLQRRVMEQAEWILLPQAIQMIAHNQIAYHRRGGEKA